MTLPWSKSAEKRSATRLRRLLHAGIFGRSDLVEGHALGLELGQRLLGLNAGLLALIITRLSHGLAHHLLLFRRELVPELLADEQDVLRIGVVGRRDEFLHFVEFVRQDDGVGIFLTVDRLVLKRRVELTEIHRHRVGFQRLEGFQKDRIGNDAQLQPAKSSTLAIDRLLFVALRKPSPQ